MDTSKWLFSKTVRCMTFSLVSKCSRGPEDQTYMFQKPLYAIMSLYISWVFLHGVNAFSPNAGQR